MLVVLLHQHERREYTMKIQRQSQNPKPLFLQFLSDKRFRKSLLFQKLSQKGFLPQSLTDFFPLCENNF